MDLFLRRRGANITRAPSWLVRAAGALLSCGAVTLADVLGLSAVTGVQPVWLELVAAFIGAVVAPTAMGGALWVITAALAACVLLVQLTPVALWPARALVRADRPNGDVDAVVVLSGGITADGRLSGEVLDRLLTGFAAVERRHVPTLALSVVARATRLGRVDTEADQRALTALLGRGVDVQFVRGVRNTRDEALAFSAFGRARGWRRVLVVTSPLHTSRACRSLEVAGLTVECLPAEPRDYALSLDDNGRSRTLTFVDVVYEVAATVLYRIRGWN